MSVCTVCNWASHDASAHGKTCVNGHPVDIVGRYGNGVCKTCQRAYSRAYWRRTHTPRLAPPAKREGQDG